LVALADDKVNEQLNQSRAVLDFFVALIALSVPLGAATVPVAVWSGEPLVLLWLPALWVLVPAWYGRAVAAVSWHAQAMQALVDLTRLPLAERLGLRLPGDLHAERRVWQAVSDYTAWGPDWTAAQGWVADINAALTSRGAVADPSSPRQPGFPLEPIWPTFDHSPITFVEGPPPDPRGGPP
jgi:hypothetical protein